MKRRTLSLFMLVFACAASEDDAESMGSSPSTGDVSSDGGSSAGTDSGKSEEGTDGGCIPDSPVGASCDAGGDCSVSCLCAEGTVDAGRCTNGRCEAPEEVCNDACEEFDQGSYSGMFCALETDGGGGTSEDPGTDDGGACVPTGDPCAINGDCCGFEDETTLCTSFEGPTACADICVFDDDCVSGCCVPLEGGGSVCGPSSFC